MKRTRCGTFPQRRKNRPEGVFGRLLAIVRKTRPDLVVLLELGARTKTTAERELLSRLLTDADAVWLRQILRAWRTSEGRREAVCRQKRTNSDR